MLIATNIPNQVRFTIYDEPTTVLDQPVEATIKVGKLNVNIPKLPETFQTPNFAHEYEVTHRNSMNLSLLAMSKELRKKADPTHNCFANAFADTVVERKTILVAHVETEEDFVIDRVQQSFVVHHYVIEPNGIYLFGSEYPEMYNTNVPLIRIFSTNRKTKEIKEVIYYADSLEPKVYRTNIGDERYEKLASLRKADVFVMIHTGSRFASKMWIRPFCKIIVCNDYIKKMDYKFHGDVVKLLDWHYHGGMPGIVPDGMIRCMDDDIDAIVKEIDSSTDYSTKKGPKWIFAGFRYETTLVAREYAQGFNERRREHAAAYAKNEHVEQPRTEHDSNKVELVIPSPPPEVYGYLKSKHDKRREKKNKREYFKKYNS